MTREELNEEIQHELDGERNKEKLKKGIKIFIKASIILFVVSTIFYAYTTYVSTVRMIVREYRVTNQKIPESFKGLKIIQISDLHYGSTMFKEELKKIKKMVNTRKPDLILFTGDLIDKNYKMSSKEQESLINELKGLHANLGKYAIFGNDDSEKIAVIMNHSDFTILRDEYDLIYKDTTNPILLVGVSSKKNNPDIDKALAYFKEESHNSNIYAIAMFHEPDLAQDILSKQKVDLLVAGHSHNGNIRLPFLKYSFFKSEGAVNYDQDYYQIDNSELYISSGLGTPNGIRLFCRPSINFYRLANH